MRNLARFFVSTSAILLLAGTAAAQGIDANQLETSLQGLVQAQGDAYVQSRDALAGQPGVAEALEQRASAWTAASWQTDTMAAVVEGRLADPATFQTVATQRGVNPEWYMQRRRAGPNVYRDLRHIAAKAAPAIVEQLLKTRVSYTLLAGDRDGWRAKEETALHAGLLMALGDSGHPAATFVLGQELANAAYSSEARQAAAVGLGTTAQASVLPALVAVANDVQADSALRVAALSGISRVPTVDAMNALNAHSAGDTPVVVRKAAVAGLSFLGSSWGWEARGQLAQSTELRRQIGLRLVDVLVAEAGNADMLQFAIQGIVSVDHPIVSQKLADLAEDETQSSAVRSAVQKATTRLQIAQRRKNRSH